MDNNNSHHLFLMKNKYKWGFPKGHINTEECYTDCARREFLEETGINMMLQFKYFFISNKIVYFIIFTDKFDYNIDNVITKSEVSGLSWFNIKDINNKKLYDYTCTNIGIKHFCQIFYKYKKFNKSYMNNTTKNKNVLIIDKESWR